MTANIIQQKTLITPETKTWFIGGILIGLAMANAGDKLYHFKENKNVRMQTESSFMDITIVSNKPKMKLLY